MALHIMNAPDTDVNWGELIGTGLKNLAHHKINKHTTESKLRFLKGSGLSHEQALHGAHLPEEHFGTLLKNIQDYRTGMPAQKTSAEKEDEKLKIQQAHKDKQLKIQQTTEAQRKLGILNKMEQLASSGKLSGGTWANLNKLLGTSSVGTTPETEQFSKLSEQLLPATKSQGELRSEQAKVPNVGQSKSAQLAIIKDLKADLAKQLGQQEEQAIEGIPSGYNPVQYQDESGSMIQEPEEGDVRRSTSSGKLAIFKNGSWIPYKE